MISNGFRRVWAGGASISVADSISEVAIPLVALTYLDASPFAIAALIAVEQAPWLILGLPSGALVDRWNRAIVLTWSSATRAIAILAVPILAILGALDLWHLFIVAVVTGTAGIFTSVAQSAILPEVVDKSELVAANSRISATTTAIDVSGKGFSGVLISVVGGPSALVIDALASILACRVFSSLRNAGGVQPKLAEESKPAESIISDVVSGLRLTFRSGLFLVLTSTAGVSNFLVAAQYAVTIPFLVEVGFSSWSIGFLLAASSVGGLIGAAITERCSSQLGDAQLWRIALLAGPVVGLLIPLTTPGVGLLWFTFGSAGLSLGLSIINIVSFSARQAAAPPEMVGRMASTSMFLTWGLIPVGALCGGLLGDTVGLRGTLWALAGAYFLPSVIAYVSPLRTARVFFEQVGQP